MVKKKPGKAAELAKEIGLPNEIAVTINDNILSIKGPKGEVAKLINKRNASVRISDKKIIISTARGTKRDKKILGSLAACISNMINGCMESHVYTLKICSGHFPMSVSLSDNRLVVKNFLGEKVPRTLELKRGASIKVEGELIHVTSANKELAGQVSADIEQLTRRPGYDTRVFQDGCYIIMKAGKELK